MESEYPKYKEWAAIMGNVQALYTLLAVIALLGVVWLLMSKTRYPELYRLLRVLLPGVFYFLIVFTLLGGALKLW